MFYIYRVFLHTTNFYTEKFLHTANFHTQQAFTHKTLAHSTFTHGKRLHTHTQRFLHRDVFAQRAAFTHNKLLHTTSFTHNKLWQKKNIQRSFLVHNHTTSYNSKIGPRHHSEKKTILERFFKRFLKGKLLPPKLRKSAGKSMSQPWYSHSNTIY